MTASHGLPAEETAKLTQRVTILSVATAAVLVAMKSAAWLASDSTAVLASLADSALDLVASLATAFAVRYAVAPPDAEHRYGHGKAEAFASLLQAGLVFASAALIGREAMDDLLDPHPLRAEGWAVAVMIVSTLLTLGLVTAQTRMLRKAASVAVKGDRAHYLADLGSNAIALVGIAGSAALGLNGLDAAAAILIAGLLLWGAVGVFRDAADQLMDRELPDEVRAEIRRLAEDDPRVLGVHQLRTRAAGPYQHVQMHMDFDPALTLAACHEAIAAAEARIAAVFPSADVLIHPDPHGAAEVHAHEFDAGATR